jgi:hypothetical protein
MLMPKIAATDQIFTASRRHASGLSTTGKSRLTGHRDYTIRRRTGRVLPEELAPLPEDSGRRFRLSVDSEQRGEGRWIHRFHHEALNPSDAELTATYFVELEFPEPIGPLEVLDPFVMMLAYRQMALGGRLTVDGPVSRRLLRNLAFIQGHSHNRWPEKYRPFAVEAGEVVETAYTARRRSEGLLAVSGGIDSTLALYRLTDPRFSQFAHPLALCVTTIGYNPRANRMSPDFEARHLDLMRKLSSRRGLGLGVMRSDLWRIPHYVQRPHGAVFGGMLALTAPSYPFGVLASSNASTDPWRDRPSGPEWQPHYGTGGFDVPSALAFYTRAERVVLLAEYGREAYDSLVVCGSEGSLPDNCGRCAKCVRTMLSFAAAGLPMPQSFTNKLDEKDIGFGASGYPEIGYYSEILDLAAGLGTDNRLVRLVRRRMRWKTLKRRTADFVAGWRNG